MKLINWKRKYGSAVAATSAAFVVAVPVALACTTEYDAITSAVDWADVIAGVGTVAAAVAGVLIVMRGSRMLLSMIRR